MAQNSIMRARVMALLCCGTAGLLAANAAEAQALPEAAPAAEVAPHANDVEDIIVTARKREESLIASPVTVSALNAAGINRYNATDLTRISENIPSIQVTRASTGTGGLIAIRGIYSPQNNPGFESSVSVAIDGIQLSRGYLTQAAFFDLRQVEVLKGPQALFFGKNSPAGVISLKSADPGNSWEGYAKGGYEFRANERYVEGAIGGPVSSDLGVRLAVRASKMDGWLKNDALPIANPFMPSEPLPGATNNKVTPAARSIALRGTAVYKPTSDFTATLKLLYSDYRDNELSGQVQAVRCNGRPHPTTLGQVDLAGDCEPDNHRSVGALPDAITAGIPYVKDNKFFSTNKSFLGSLALGYNLSDDIALNSVTGYYDLNALGYGSYDGTVFNQYAGVNGDKSKQFSQELRLTSTFDAPVNFMMGAYYEYSKRNVFTVGYGGFGVPVPFDTNFGNRAIGYWNNDYQNGHTYSGFAQILWDIADDVQLSGGVRYTKETKRAITGMLYVNPGLPAAVATLLPAGSTFNFPFRDSNWSPEATLTWHPAPDQTLYASYKTGYKSGGLSLSPIVSKTDTLAKVTFGSETAEGGEIGYKAQLLDRRLTVTTAIYSYKFNDLQRAAYDPPTNSFLIRNAASARTKGAEAELSFRASDAITLRSSANYNDAHFLKFTNAPCYTGQVVPVSCAGTIKTQDISGQTIALAPKFTGSAGFSFDTPVSDGLSFGLNGDIRYVSRYRTQDDNTPLATQKGYAKVNGSVRVHSADDSWEVSLVGVNLFNKYAILSTTSKPGGASGDLYGVVERGREVRVQGMVRF
tara:strand:+ start:5342 stop:7765 length:2424 start_codon:yes stop_codon:yes gene_type:complete